MAIKKIVVAPETLEDVARRLEEFASQYRGHYQKLYGTVDGTKANWTGEDNIAFVNQIGRYRDDFEGMYAALSQYAAHLKTSAKSYRATEEALRKEATTLGTGLGN